MRKFTGLGHVPNRSGHCINNHKTKRTVVISPGCATLSVRSASMQLLGKEVPEYFLDDELHTGVHGYVMTAISSISTDLPPEGYECLQLVRHPFSRLWSIWTHVLKWQMHTPEGSMSLDNVLKTMISWKGRNTKLGEYRTDVHLVPQCYRRPSLETPFVKLEEGGYQKVCEFLGVDPVVNRKKDRQKITWQGRWKSEGRDIAERLYLCDFDEFDYLAREDNYGN